MRSAVLRHATTLETDPKAVTLRPFLLEKTVDGWRAKLVIDIPTSGPLLDQQDRAPAQETDFVARGAPARSAALRIDFVGTHHDQIDMSAIRGSHDLAGRFPDAYVAANGNPSGVESVGCAAKPVPRHLEQPIIESPHLAGCHIRHLLLP